VGGSKRAVESGGPEAKQEKLGRGGEGETSQNHHTLRQKFAQRQHNRTCREKENLRRVSAQIMKFKGARPQPRKRRGDQKKRWSCEINKCSM